jgi:hypothetical protein
MTVPRTSSAKAAASSIFMPLKRSWTARLRRSLSAATGNLRASEKLRCASWELVLPEIEYMPGQG